MAAGELIHPGRFDADRGGIVQRDQSSDIKVCMYVDEPGVFFTMSGYEVSDDVARAAGYDVDKLRGESEFLRAKREAIRRVEAEYEAKLGEIESSRANPKPERVGVIEVPLKTSEKPVNKWVPRGGPEKLRSTEYHEMSHRGRGIWDVFNKGTDKIVLEKVDEATAVAFMQEQAQELAELATG